MKEPYHVFNPYLYTKIESYINKRDMVELEQMVTFLICFDLLVAIFYLIYLVISYSAGRMVLETDHK